MSNTGRWHQNKIVEQAEASSIMGTMIHASEFIPGFVTFVGEQEPGIW